MPHCIPPLGPALPTATPWWRVSTMWLVVGGPLAVVVAGFVTLALAWHNMDPVVSNPPQVSVKPVPHSPAVPAMQARNHAATPAR